MTETSSVFLQHGFLRRFRHHAVRFVVLHYQVLLYTNTAKLYLLVTDVVGRIGRRFVLYPLFVPEDLKQR
ncbi:hypothetical protein HAX54_014673 [Datura stramonium]|uniref:Uncharacterized protein n=1 Tax=Datura stramonium TaxID=4076 RepID=A0ABS8TQB4_DATST|nr:hypothetical protein [Datura stramonium]